MHANKPEMAEKWEAHTPKGKKLPKKVKKKRKPQKMRKPRMEKQAYIAGFLRGLLGEEQGTPSAFGPNIPLFPRFTNEQIAQTTYFNRMMRLLHSPNLSEADRRRVRGAMKDRLSYGVNNNPHIGIPPKSLLTAIFGGLSIPSELRGEENPRESGV